MPAAHHDTIIERGATWSLGVQYPEGDPMNLSTGWEAVVQLRATVDAASPITGGDASAYVTLSAGSPTANNIELAAPPAWTLALTPGTYQWALLLQQPDADPPYGKYLLEGAVSVVTRAAR